VFEFKPNIGLEVNLNLDYNVVIGVYDGYYDDYYNDYYSNDFAGGGILFNPEVKFRYNVFAIGLDFAFTKVTEYFEEEYFNGTSYEYYKRDTPFTAINFTFGAKLLKQLLHIKTKTSLIAGFCFIHNNYITYILPV
jgi:hypothetical protein